MNTRLLWIARNLPSKLKRNQIQVLGTHNTYAQPADPRVLALVDPQLSKLRANLSGRLSSAPLAQFNEEHPNKLTFSEVLAYSHPSRKTQLDAGLRSLEIDVNPDPVGGLFLQPAAFRLLRSQGITVLAAHNTAGLEQPGFIVLHVPDVDFRSLCNTSNLCLTQIREWSGTNPWHISLFILVEAKSQAIPILPTPTQLASFDAKGFDDLDAEVLSVLGRKRVIATDDVRGKYPTLKSARGKIIFLLITAAGKLSSTLRLAASSAPAPGPRLRQRRPDRRHGLLPPRQTLHYALPLHPSRGRQRPLQPPDLPLARTGTETQTAHSAPTAR